MVSSPARQYGQSINRRQVLTGLGLACLARPASAANVKNLRREALIGAIRWDAWYVAGSVPTDAVAASLSPDRYHWRAPFFAESGKDSINFPQVTQAEIDLEIAQAVYAGLDYWAFVSYSQQDPMSEALTLYLTSKVSEKIKFCLFTELTHWGTTKTPSDLINRDIRLMNSVDYVRVRDRRPLYFLGAVNEQIVSQRWGSVSALRDEINNFRGAVEASGSGNPYIALTGDRAKIGEIARALGGDAITMYAVSAPLRSAPYDALVHVAEEAWNALEDQGLPVVPTVMTGWDRRPRIERPVPWERFQRPGVGADEYFDAGRPQQIARHLQEGLSWLARRPQEKRAPAILIYAWNENDEGGWLIPTLPCDTKRIEALHAMLSPNNSAPNPNCNF